MWITEDQQKPDKKHIPNQRYIWLHTRQKKNIYPLPYLHASTTCTVQSKHALPMSPPYPQFPTPTTCSQPPSRTQFPGKRYLNSSTLFNKYDGRLTAEYE
ncbi:hypothetical protein Hanom_Chr09g00821431 [Helianthus anomalus]